MHGNLKIIAKEAGVSPTTVSLVLNNKTVRVANETRQKIIDIAKKYNYQSKNNPIALDQNRTTPIGLIVANLSNVFFTELARGVEKYAQSMGYSVLLCNIEESTEKCITYISHLSSLSVAGIMIAPSIDSNVDNNNLKMIDIFAKSKIPLMLIDRAITDVFCDFVCVDNKQGGYIATKHLLELGHRRIGCISGPMSTYSGRGRLQGYKDALAEYEIPVDDSLIFDGDYEFKSGVEGAKSLLKQNVTAIFACNDLMAYGVNKHLSSIGLKVPDDLSLVGFDNTPLSEMMDLPLTTVNQPIDLLGQRSCEILINKIGTRDLKHKDYYFAPNLIVRKSTRSI